VTLDIDEEGKVQLEFDPPPTSAADKKRDGSKNAKDAKDAKDTPALAVE
jgi:hypothetical protein